MKKIFLVITVLFMYACSLPTFSIKPPEKTEKPTIDITESPRTPVSPTSVPTLSQPETPLPFPTEIAENRKSEAIFPQPYAENRMINFVTVSCNASWSNNLAYFACPGDRMAVDGAVVNLNQPVLSNGITIRNRGLLTIPGYGSHGGGIFGRYQPYNVDNERTHFRAALTCLSFPCQADFGLGFYDNAGKYEDLISWNVNSSDFSEEGGFWKEVDYDLSRFLGQSIEFVLFVRNAPNQRVEALWIEPIIYLKY